ncbi:TonB-dependent vitamin B12 receptor BtuB [Edwardsiella tarda]|uniref:TonB-dependent vitamin B12 receptor BtuB n=1 Tax=Edwardsiella tarda TaxID=636 RepID=UPI003A870F99
MNNKYPVIAWLPLTVVAMPNAALAASSDMVVTTSRFSQPVSTVLAPMDVVTRDDIERWQSKSLDEVMRRLPGVDIAQNGGVGQNSTLYLRGSEARQALILLDGIPLARPGISNVAALNKIPIAMVQRIEYIRGPRSAVYGSGAIGGVINIITLDAEPGARLGIGTGSNHYQQYDAGVRQQLGDTTLSLAGAFQSTEGFNVKPDSPYAPDGDRDGFRNKVLWGGVEHRFTQAWSGFVRGHGYSDASDYDAGKYGKASSGTQRQLYNHSYDMGLRYQSGVYAAQLIAAYQRVKDYNYGPVYGRYGEGSSLDDLRQYNLQWGNTYRFDSGMLSAGADWQQQRLISSDIQKKQHYQRYDTGFYLSGQHKVGSVTLEASGRADNDQQFGWHGTWQSAAGWEFASGYRATLSYGTGFLSPSLGQQFGADRMNIKSNPDLRPEESRQWELGLSGLSGPLDWQLSAYRNQVRNLITYFSDPDTQQGQYLNIDSATIKGVEWVGSFDTWVVSHRITLQYIDPRDDKTGELLPRRSRHQGKYQLDWTMGPLEMDLAYQYYGRRNDSSAPGGKLPSYSTMDVSASYPVTSHLTVRGRIGNLLDKNYQTAYGYQTAGREYYLSGSYTF